MAHRIQLQHCFNKISRPANAQQLVASRGSSTITEAAESKSMRERPSDTSDATIRLKNRQQDQMVNL